MKLTQEIENYIHCKFHELYQGNQYTYSSEIIAKVKEIFGVPFSSGTRRLIFNDEKRILSEQKKCVSEVYSKRSKLLIIYTLFTLEGCACRNCGRDKRDPPFRRQSEILN